MTSTVRLLEAIRDTADPFGGAQPIDVAKRLRINIGALARVAPGLQRTGLIEIDEDAGTLSLTEAGRAQVDGDEDENMETPPPSPIVAKEPAPIVAPPAAPVVRTPAIEPPTVAPVVGQLDLIPLAGRPVKAASQRARPEKAKAKPKAPAKRR